MKVSAVSEGKNETTGDICHMSPKQGMEFDSTEDVLEFYNKYAQCIGFGIKIRGSWRDDDGIIYRYILSCVREGRFEPRNSQNNKRKVIDKCQCKAQITTSLQRDGKYRLTSVHLGHNHLVSPSKSRFFLKNRNVNVSPRKVLNMNDAAGISVAKSVRAPATCARGFNKIGFGEKHAGIYVGSARRLRLSEDDAEAVRLYFMRKQKQNSNFFHLMDIDDGGRIQHVFWADARSRAMYPYFSDVISFDTTYLTNKYDMPFVPFVGINHHGQSILLGCGLLFDETMDSYEWLFTSWLSCMNGHPPNAIIIDQCPSVQAAVSKVFPNARHRLCLWHITRKVSEKFIACKDCEKIVSIMKRVVYDTLRVEEFEQSWEQMIVNSSLRDNKWLRHLYEIRHRWVPVYVKDTFWARMSTTQCSESMNAFFDGYVHAKTSLKQFISQYDEVALERKNENESVADFNSFHGETALITSLPYEIEICNVYTSAMFAKFQDELRNTMNCRVKLLDHKGLVSRFEVKEKSSPSIASEPIVKNYEVWFHSEALVVHCICKSFESCGILSSHAICVLDHSDVPHLPPRYITHRWRKDFKRLHVQERSSRELTGFASAPVERYDDISM